MGIRGGLPALWIVLLNVYLVNAEPRFWSTGWNKGSLNGATRLHLYGREFAAEQFSSPVVGNEGLGNKVFLRGSTTTVECDVITYYTNREQIVCDTRPAPKGNYRISVEVDGVDVEDSSGYVCNGGRGCYFEYTSDHTPTIISVTPSSGSPGTLVSIRGKMFTALFNNFQLANGELDKKHTDREIQRVYWGNYICDLDDDDGNLYGISLERDGRSNTGSLRCKPMGTFIASQPMSYLVSKNFGRSRAEAQSLLVSGKNELYNYQSHAVVDSVEPTEGSTAGGLLVKITGNYFDDDTVVLIGGAPCAVVNSTVTTIQCVTSPMEPEMTAFPGSRGLNREVWLSNPPNNLEDAVFNDTLSDFRFEYALDASLEDDGPLDPPNRFMGRLRGFYVPPRDGYYMFSVACDDRAYLYLSTSSRPEDKVEIAYCPRHGYDYFAYPGATSSKIYLEGSKHYYIESTVLDLGGPGYTFIGVHMYDTPFVKSDIDSAIHEKQRISVTTVEHSEIQVLARVPEGPETQVVIVEYDDCNEFVTILAPASDLGTTGTAPSIDPVTSETFVTEVVTSEIFVTEFVTCPPPPKFTLSFMGEETGEFTAGVDPMEIESALNALSALQSISVEVYSTEDMAEGIYYIAFLKKSTGNLPEIEARVTDGIAKITILEDQPAILHFEESFSVVLDGVASKSIDFATPVEEVQEAMLDMITIQCERTTSGKAHYAQDYEEAAVGFETGVRTSEAEPFCGRRSLMNPGEIFKAGSTAADDGSTVSSFNAQYTKQLCFGYRGTLSGQMKLGVGWMDEEKKDRYDTVTAKYEVYNTDNWQHICVDLEVMITSTWIGSQYRSAGGLKVHTIQLLGDQKEGFYIDNLYIGNKADQYERTSRIPKPNGIFLLNITVEKSINDSFIFTFVPAGCGHGFPMMGIVGADVSSGSSSGPSVRYESSSWAPHATLEVTQTQPASPEIGGTFDLSQDGVTIPGVDVTTSATKMKSLVQAYLDVIVDVERTGSCSGSHWDITWTSKGGLQPLIEINDTMVTGNLVNSSSQRLEEGRLFLGPIPGEFLRTFHYTPQVEVIINGIPSRCDGNCSFEYTTKATPTLTGITPSTGTGCANTAITLTGTGFSSLTDENNVTIGGQECVVTASTETSITCTVGITETGKYAVSVQVARNGYAAQPGGDVAFTHELEVTSFSPVEGSTAGGTVITVSGCGFSAVIPENSITLGDSTCGITAATNLEIVCAIEMNDNAVSSRKRRASDTPLIVVVNGVMEESDGMFTFDSSMTPTITSISPAHSSVLGGGNLTLSGTAFTTSDASVMIGGLECAILSQTDTEIVCVIPPHKPGSYDIELTVGVVGFADVQAIDKFKYLLKVGGVFPSHGSTMGGTLLSIKGEGFGTNPADVSVSMGGFPCEVQAVSDGEISCLTTSPTQTYEVTNDGRHETYGVGYAWNPQVLKVRAGDTVAWQWDVPAYVNGIQYTVQQTADGDTLTYDGTGFYAGPASSRGGYNYTFTAPGTYYYSSGPVDGEGTIHMTGTIHVSESRSEALEVDVNVGGYSALHSPGSASADASDPCEVSTGVDSCTDAAPQGSDPALVYFSYFDCSTPTVESISPISGTSGDEIVITGKGFGDSACQHDIQLGDHSCIVSSASSTRLACTIDISAEPPVGYWMELSLTVKNLGSAGVLINNPAQRSFTLVPHIEFISHSSGSTAGGLLITITGNGFSASDAPAISVAIGGAPCIVESFTYTTILCATSEKTAGTYSMTGSVNSIPAVVESSATFTYSADLTTTLSSVSPSSFSGPGTELIIEGANFPSSAEDITVTIAGVDCAVLPVSADSPSISCEVGYVPVGTHDVIVNIADRGNAQLNGASTQVESQALLSSVSPNEGSKRGGQLLTIEGNGFVAEDTQVTISDLECSIQSVTLSVITCITPWLVAGEYDLLVTSSGIAYNTLRYTTSHEATPRIDSVTPTSAASGDTITITGAYFSDTAGDIRVTIDDVPCVVTSATAESVECTLGEHSAGSYLIVLFRDNFGLGKNDLIFMEYSLTASAAPVECGFGGGITLTLTGTGFAEDSTAVYVCDQVCPIATITTTEITCDVPGMTESGSVQVCDITVSLPDVGVNATVADAVTYRSTLTSHITDVSPRRGGTGGGTTVTITGNGFLPSGNDVTIAGTPCVVQSESATEIVCQTGEHTPTESTKVRVDVGASGIATQDKADFFYVDVWSSVYTWGGKAPPVEGDFVIIPAGNTILLDQTTPILSVLLLQGGHMVFDEKDIELHAEYIIITDGGSLTVGTEDEPFQHQATIMMHGHVRSQELPMFGAKVLAVRNGTLDLHGQPVALTWTHLAATVDPGDTQMTLKQPVDWKVGDQIVIATTSHRHSQVESEMLTITDISSDEMTLTFTPALKYKHISLLQTIDGVTLETRAEVGLLTRNVKFRGSVQDEWTEKIDACEKTFNTNQFATQTCFQGRFGEEIGSDQYGGHIMLFAKEMDKDWIVGRISYVEVTHAGQAFRLGRYPIHFHMSGDITGSYVRGCGIYNTFNRAVTVHGVHGFLVEHNVAYNIMGHAFFLEDGIESGNTIQYNLAIFVRPSSSLLNVDITPAAYWITNPNNTVRHNAAAGGSHFGFWYNAPQHPEGPSYTPDIFPRTLPLGQFTNNSVHSQGWYGIWIFPIYYPSEPAKFDTLTAWEVERGAEATEVGRVQFHNFLISDAEASGLEYQTVAAPWGVTGGYINNSVVIGYSDVNDNDANGECTGTGVQLPKSRFLTVDGVKFINFDRGCTAIAACGHCKPHQGGYEHRLKNLQFTNAPNKVNFKWEHETWLEDLDGSLTGEGANYIALPQTYLLPPDHCQMDVDYLRGGAVPGAVCDPTVKLHRMAWNDVSPSSLDFKDVIFENANGNSSVPWEMKRLTHPEGWVATVMEGDDLNMRFENVEHVTNISYAAQFDEFGDGEYVYITHSFTQRPDAFALVGTVWNGTEDLPDPATSSHGDFTFNNDTKQLTYIVTGNGASEPENKFVDLDVYRCFYKDCITPQPAPPPAGRPDEVRLWSDIASWEDAPEGWGGNKGDGVFGLPEAGDTVQIPTDVWMVADVPLPPMQKLVIYGTLEIEDSRDQVIDATYVFIHGGRLVAGFSEEEPFTHNLHFTLRGNHETPDIPLPSGPNMGSKVLGVFGGLDLHGVTRDVTWTHLAVTVLPGEDTIQLAEETDWVVGDEIVVTTTSYETWHTETFVIIERVDGTNFKLNSSFTYTHTAETHRLSDDSAEYTMAAEVGLLTRNILIEGADYPDLFEESFGARVLVGRFSQDGEEFTGFARISNVEFKHTGQEGWTDFHDPRYSLAFLDAGEVTEERPSYVRGCSFHNGFSTAIGVYGTHGLEVSDNVIHHVVGPGIISWGEDTQLIHNLVTVVIFPGTYQDRFESTSLLLIGAIEVEEARNPILINNTIAGSEQMGYKVKGELCSESVWYGNTVHSALHGVHLFQTSQPECSHISNFYIWNSYDYAIYAQIKSSLLVTDSVLVDNSAGIMGLIKEPAALSHVASNKFVEVRDTLLVGTSPSYDCNAVNPEIGPFMSDHRSPKGPGISTVGFYIASFMSSKNGAPKKPFSRVNSYPAINGISRLTDVTFANYGSACGRRQVAMITAVESHDASHPLEARKLRFVDVEKDSYVYIHRPAVGKVNPADCVDMDCDGMKKVLIRDLDGSILGSVGTLIPESEYEWDGDSRRGLGDYRIPKTMLTSALDGSRIEPDTLAPQKGINRGSGSDCSWKSAWQAYECHNIDHMMMVIESMDADTETRRVSPLGLLAGGYVDLINGPQDNGWCHGYTCQERISTFYSIVATGLTYDLDFTGTNPQHLRYHLLHADESQSLVVSTYYTNPQRLDVYVNGVYILPTNGALENGEFTWKAPAVGETNSDYYPGVDSSVLGENYFDRDLNRLFILIRGSDVVEVVTSPVIMLTFGFPATAVDDFFEENLVQNLANLLNIPASKIRIVEIISENGRRKRRAEGEVELVVEIGNPPASNTTTEATVTDAPGDDEGSLSPEELRGIQSTVADEMQTGGLEDALGAPVTSMVMTDPVDPPEDPTGGVRATNESVGSVNETGIRYDEKQALEEEASDTGTPQQYRAPSRIIVVEQPGDAKESHPFMTQPKLKVVDAVGNLVEHLGHSSNPWRLEVTLRTSNTGAAVSSVNPTHSFTDGWLNFTDLAVNSTGSGFILDFTIIHPNTTDLTASSAEFEVQVRPLGLRVIDQPVDMIEGKEFDIGVQLIDVLSGDDVTDLGEKGYDVWTATTALYMPSNYRGTLEGDLSTTFDLSTGRATFNDLTVTSTGFSYLVKITMETTPTSNYSFTQTIEGFDVVDPNAVTYSGEAVTLKIRFNADYATVAAGQEEAIEIYFLNQIAAEYENVTFSDVNISPGSILIAFAVTGDVEGLQTAIWDDIIGGQLILNYNGHSIPADTFLLVDGVDYTGPTATGTGLPIWVLILVALIVILMIVVIAVVVYVLFCKKAAKSASSSVVELHQMDKSKQDLHKEEVISENHRLCSPTPTIIVDEEEDTQKLIDNRASSPRDDVTSPSRSPRLNHPRRSPELSVTALPPGFTDGQYVYEKDDFEELSLMVRNQDGTFQKLGKVKVNMVGKVQDIREELRSNALPPKVRDRPFILLDEKLQDLTSDKEKTLVASEVYAGESVLIKWVLEDDTTKVCICGLVGQFSCSLCHKQSYCSPLCQSKDWPRHSMQCTIYSGEI